MPLMVIYLHPQSNYRGLHSTSRINLSRFSNQQFTINTCFHPHASHFQSMVNWILENPVFTYEHLRNL